MVNSLDPFIEIELLSARASISSCSDRFSSFCFSLQRFVKTNATIVVVAVSLRPRPGISPVLVVLKVTALPIKGRLLLINFTVT